MADFKSLFEERYKDLQVKEGVILKGIVAGVNRDTVMVDVGFKSEGLIDIEEFRNFDGEIDIKPGTPVDVVVEQMEDPRGNLILSKERADAIHSWDRVEEVFNNGLAIEGLVVNKIKGGMSVNLGGIKAFLPASQIDLKPVKSLDKLIGHKYQFKILKLNKIKGNVVLSRRAVLEEERVHQKKELLENLREGQVVQGLVKNVTDYGAFVDLGGIDGLLHITDMTWGRISHPSEVMKVGDEVEVVVLRYDHSNEKISLGYKQLKADPWKDVEDNYTVGQQVRGKAVNIADYGVFVELAEGIEGLVHLSELTWNKKIKHPSKLVKQGDEIDAVILDMDPANRRISLGVRQLETNPWIGLEEKYQPGTKIKGVVQNVTDFGIFIGIEGEKIDGLVHVSDLGWDKNIKNPGDLFKPGQEVEAVVLSVDKENERFALGIKQLTDDPWEMIRKKYAVGSEVKGVISEVEEKGVSLSLEHEMTGYISSGDLGLHGKGDINEKFKKGDEITAAVKKFDERAKRVVMSVKTFEKSQEKKAVKEFHEKQGDSSVKLKDAVK